MLIKHSALVSLCTNLVRRAGSHKAEAEAVAGNLARSNLLGTLMQYCTM